MYAIIEEDGRQVKVEEGQQVRVDYREVSAGTEIVFDRVLAVRDEAELKLGRPTLPEASVTATVLGVEQGPKIVVRKLRRRKGYRRKTGHRQLYTTVRVEKINAG